LIIIGAIGKNQCQEMEQDNLIMIKRKLRMAAHFLEKKITISQRISSSSADVQCGI